MKSEFAGGAGYKDCKPKDKHMWWHAAVGHPGDRNAAKMLELGFGDLKGVKITKKSYAANDHWCNDCALGKCKQAPHKSRVQKRLPD